MRSLSTTELLRSELAHAGVRLDRVLPAWCRTSDHEAWFLGELRKAITPELHEARLAPLSLLLVETDDELLASGTATRSSDLALLAADGRARSAALTPSQGWSTIANVSAQDPHRFLGDLTTVYDGVGLLRDPNGIVYVFTHAATLRHQMRSWTVRPGTADAVSRIQRSVPQIDTSVLADVLELATRTLSPRGVGATLVLPVGEVAGERRPEGLRYQSRLARAQDVADLALTIADGDALAHVLAHVDGATMLTMDGKVASIGAHLLATDRSTALIPARKGTRHTSAIRLSYDVPEVIVIAVSADGPVSVFSDGINLFEVDWWSAAHEARQLEQALSPLVQEAAWTGEGDIVECANCGKSSIVERLTVAGWSTVETAACPVCAHVIAEGHCVEIRANIVKRL